MTGLPLLYQTSSAPGQDWWWSTLASRPALLLLALALVCLAGIVYLGWRLRSLSSARQAVPVRKRMADDSGVAMIEFVLVTPVLLFLTLLLVQTMLVFTGVFYVQYAAFAAARSAIVHIPMESSEPRNTISTELGSEKFDAIQSSAVLALMPVAGRENGSAQGADGLASGFDRVYQAQGKDVPPWVEGMLAERLTYAINHTEVSLEEILPGSSEDTINSRQASGVYTFSPKASVGARVRHEFALTVPLASRIFTLVGESGTYSPASVNSDTPGPPGHWTKIESRAILTNEGIDRRLPEAPPVPRR